MVWARCSAIMRVVRLVLAVGMVGMIDASMILRLVVPWTLPVASTTACTDVVVVRGEARTHRATQLVVVGEAGAGPVFLDEVIGERRGGGERPCQPYSGDQPGQIVGV
jgi:hypothetical protein